jgi:hypothetical protein
MRAIWVTDAATLRYSGKTYPGLFRTSREPAHCAGQLVMLNSTARRSGFRRLDSDEVHKNIIIRPSQACSVAVVKPDAPPHDSANSLKPTSHFSVRPSCCRMPATATLHYGREQ